MAAPAELLTIVLPLKGRAEYTFRWMQYADSSGFPFRVIVADGADDDVVARVLSIPSNYPRVRYEYIRYPFDATYSEFYSKMVDALSRVETPFAAVMDNDSFHIAAGLVRAVAFLVEHPEYSTCRGQHLDFRLRADGSEGTTSVLHGSSIEIDHDYFDKAQSIWRCFDEAASLDRIDAWARSVHITYSNVFRTEVLRQAWAFTKENDLVDLWMMDVAITLFALVNGKSEVFDGPFMMRQQNSPGGVSKELVRRADILDRMLMESWTRNLNSLVEAIAKVACDKGGYPLDQARSRIKQSLKHHYADRLEGYLAQRSGAKASALVPPLEFTKDLEIHPHLRLLVAFLLTEPTYSPPGALVDSGGRRDAGL